MLKTMDTEYERKKTDHFNEHAHHTHRYTPCDYHWRFGNKIYRINAFSSGSHFPNGFGARIRLSIKGMTGFRITLEYKTYRLQAINHETILAHFDSFGHFM